MHECHVIISTQKRELFNMTYTPEQFDVLLTEFQSKTVDLLKSKQKDYANKSDVLKNFREVAIATNTTPEQVAIIYMMKHIQALSNMSSRGDYVWDWVKPDGSEGAKQRVADAINYLYLLAAIMEDRQVKKNA